MADFQEFYGLDLGDLWTGRLSQRRAWVLAEQLRTIPGSRYRAAVQGGVDHLGWGIDRAIAADTRDLLLMLMKALGGKSTTEKEMWPRPKTQPKHAAVRAQTVAEFDIDGFMRQLSS